MAAPQVEDEAFVTLATNDSYCLGAMVLGHSLKHVGTTRKLVVMISPQVSGSIRSQLSGIFDLVVEVDVLDSQDVTNLALLSRPDLGCTFTKFHCWRLTQFSKCVFLDADTLVLQNCDELFERDEFSAAPDAGWPDCFNSGVFVFRPSENTYQSLLSFAVSHGTFDGGDQGLLNLFYSDWSTKDISKHLPFIYNVVSQAFYSYLPAFKQFGKNVKICHFIGEQKPWRYTVDPTSGQVQTDESTVHNQTFLQIWWRYFLSLVHPFLDPTLAKNPEGGIVGQLAGLKLAGPSPEPLPQMNEREWQYAWERGQIDYLGIDSFENIKSKIEDTLGNGAKKPPSAEEEGVKKPASKSKTSSKSSKTGKSKS
ncbi:glycogenin-1-like isoform X2 [Lineus longissimus]|uniref:glycogenin-1-like isoform X2 n=1 Tax=Lineus longissimus TaxID=88925 RepID=UPI002B4E1FA9